MMWRNERGAEKGEGKGKKRMILSFPTRKTQILKIEDFRGSE